MPSDRARSTVLAQRCLGVARKGVDEVEADPSEVRLRGLQRRRPSSAEWARPRKARRLVVELWRPSDTRLTPAAARSAKRAASTEEGLASSVISMSSAKRPMPLRRVDDGRDVGGAISEGVPPPKKIEVEPPAGKQLRLVGEVGEQERSRHSS